MLLRVDKPAPVAAGLTAASPSSETRCTPGPPNSLYPRLRPLFDAAAAADESRMLALLQRAQRLHAGGMRCKATCALVRGVRRTLKAAQESGAVTPVFQVWRRADALTLTDPLRSLLHTGATYRPC